MFVPLRQSRVEHGSIGDQHRLPMIGRGQRRLVAKADHDLGPVLAKLLRQEHAGLERIEQPPVRQVERHTDGRPERFRRSLRFRQTHFRSRRARRRLAVGQVDNADLIALLHEFRERAAASDFDIIGMSADGNDIELGILFRIAGHGEIIGRLSGPRCLGLAAPPPSNTFRPSVRIACGTTRIRQAFKVRIGRKTSARSCRGVF